MVAEAPPAATEQEPHGGAAAGDGSPPLPSPAAQATPRTLYRSSAFEAAVENWATRWALPAGRVALAMPLVYAAAAAAGFTLYLLGLLGSTAPYEAGSGVLATAALCAFTVCVLALLGWGVLLNERPRRRSWLPVLLTAAALFVPSVLAAALDLHRAMALATAAALSGVVLAAAVAGAAGHWRLETGRGAERDHAGSRRAWLWRLPLWLLAVAGACGAALVTLSVFTASFLPAQEAFGLGPTSWQIVTGRSGAALAGGVLAVALVNVAAACLFGLFVNAAARLVGRRRGRLHLWWTIAAAVTLPLGVIAWLLDSSLPRW